MNLLMAFLWQIRLNAVGRVVVMWIPSKRVMSSPFLHKTISFSESSAGDQMLYVAIKFDYKIF